MKKLASIIDALCTLGLLGGRGAGVLLLLPFGVIVCFFWGVLTLNVPLIFSSILLFALSLLIGIPFVRFMHNKKAERLNKFDDVVREIEELTPYNMLYRFEPPRQYENIDLNEYLPKLRRLILMGAGSSVTHIESSNNVVLNVWFVNPEPELDGLWYVS